MMNQLIYSENSETPSTIVDEEESEKSKRFHGKRKSVPTTTPPPSTIFSPNFIILKSPWIQSMRENYENKKAKYEFKCDLIQDVVNLNLDYSRLELKITIKW